MAFDPNLPASGTPVLSAELRDQFNGLKELADARAARVDDVEELSIDFYDPPSKAQVESIVDKLNEVIRALKRA